MGCKTFLAPLLVILCEYTAVAASFAYAQYAVDYTQPEASLLGGLIKIGRSISYEAVPTMVIILHLAALAASLVFFSSYVWAPFSGDRTKTATPQEG